MESMPSHVTLIRQTHLIYFPQYPGLQKELTLSDAGLHNEEESIKKADYFFTQALRSLQGSQSRRKVTVHSGKIMSEGKKKRRL